MTKDSNLSYTKAAAGPREEMYWEAGFFATFPEKKDRGRRKCNPILGKKNPSNM